jgi:hypothetical protein
MPTQSQRRDPQSPSSSNNQAQPARCPCEGFRTELNLRPSTSPRGRRLAAFRACLNVVPDSTKNQPLVPCTKPHLAGSTTAISMPAYSGKYPNQHVLHAAGQRLCPPTLPPHLRAQWRPGDVVVYAGWKNRPEWRTVGERSRLDGVCWYYRADHKKLPPL